MSPRPPAQGVRPAMIVSGGQTGVDRGALDAAIELGIPHGGWCPRERLAEDGRIPNRYLLRETGSSEYPVRTEQNVLDSDGTLIICTDRPSGGTLLTLRLAKQHGRPHLVVDLDDPPEPGAVIQWLAKNGIATLNVAGPRESQAPGISVRCAELVKAVFSQV